MVNVTRAYWSLSSFFYSVTIAKALKYNPNCRSTHHKKVLSFQHSFLNSLYHHANSVSFSAHNLMKQSRLLSFLVANPWYKQPHIQT